jgi:hypothetical protein
MRRVLVFLLALLVVMPLAAQYNIYRVPDCSIFFSLSTAGASVSYDNRTKGCTTWTVAYNSYGFSALSLVLQSAPNTSSGAGTFVTFAGTVMSGSNPSTDTARGQVEASGYYPYVRMNLASATGTGLVTGTLYGFKTQAVLSGSVYTGIGYETPFVCTNSAAISLSASGNTQIIALSGSTAIRVCHISLAMASTVDLKLVRGTGTNCGTGSADMTGVYKSVGSLALDFPAASGGLRVTAGNALCVNLGSAVTGGGLVVYAQY